MDHILDNSLVLDYYEKSFLDVLDVHSTVDSHKHAHVSHILFNNNIYYFPSLRKSQMVIM